MKKVFMIFIALIAMMSVTSCEKESFSVVYNVTIMGDAEGDFTLVFPDGSLNLKGESNLDFKWGNGGEGESISLGDAFYSENVKVREAAFYVEDEIEKFSASAARGTYYVHIVGYAEESVTGVKISIDKVLTNR